MDNKRRKEQARKLKQQDKEARRVKRLADRLLHPQLADGQDADLAGLFPGPQPVQII